MVDAQTWELLAAQAANLVLAVLIGAKAHAAWRLVPERSLGFFTVGFYLLAAGQAVATGLEYAVATSTTIERESLDHLDLLFWGYYALLFAGFVLVFLSFGRHPFRWAPALAGVLLYTGMALQFLLTVVLFFVVLHAGLHHIARKRPGSLLAAGGFFCVLTAHFLFIYTYSPLSPQTLWGELVHLAGLTLIYAGLTRPRPAAP